jgi:hypothetical protein
VSAVLLVPGTDPAHGWSCVVSVPGIEPDTVGGSRPRASRRSLGGDIVREVLDSAEGMHDE